VLGYDGAAVVAIADRRRDRTRALVGAAPPQMIPSLPPHDRETNERPNTEPTTRDTAVGGGRRLGSETRRRGGAAARRRGDSARLGSAARHGASAPWRLGGVAWRAAARRLVSARRLGATRSGAKRRLGSAAAQRRSGSAARRRAAARLGSADRWGCGAAAQKRGTVVRQRGGSARRCGDGTLRLTLQKREKTHLVFSCNEVVAFKHAHFLLLEEWGRTKLRVVLEQA